MIAVAELPEEFDVNQCVFVYGTRNYGVYGRELDDSARTYLSILTLVVI